MSQNYKNHVRFHPIYHFILVPAIVTSGIFATINAYKNTSSTSLLILIGFILFGVTTIFTRMFALKAQDRAARADERLRYYILTNQMLPKELSMGQILALRFASDEEFVELTEKALKEQLSPKEIKLAIKSWRGDYHRI